MKRNFSKSFDFSSSHELQTSPGSGSYFFFILAK